MATRKASRPALRPLQHDARVKPRTGDDMAATSRRGGHVLAIDRGTSSTRAFLYRLDLGAFRHRVA